MAKLKTNSRTISNAGQLRNIGLIPLTKASRPCAYESAVERDGIYDLAYRRDARAIVSQPETIALWIDGIKHRYTPDASYATDDGEIHLVEFKHSDSKVDDAYERKLQAAAQHYAAQGKNFRVTRSLDIRLGHRMDNIRCLHRYSRWPLPERLVQQVRERLAGRRAVALGELRTLVGQGGLGALYRMLYEQRVGVDLVSSRLNSSTWIWELPS